MSERERYPNGRFAPTSEFLRWFQQQYPNGATEAERSAALYGWCARDAELADITAERDSESRWAKDYLARAERAEAELAKAQEEIGKFKLMIASNAETATRMLLEQDKLTPGIAAAVREAIEYTKRHSEGKRLRLAGVVRALTPAEREKVKTP